MKTENIFNDLLRRLNLSGIARLYAASDTPADKLGLIEEALVTAFDRATEDFKQNQGAGDYSLREIANNLDSGRLKGQHYPFSSRAYEESVCAYNAMLARVGH